MAANLLNNRPLPPGKKYHVFLSYRDVEKDKEWVRKLIDKLEHQYGFICCDHFIDFQPGKKIVENIKYAVTSSVKTLLILSTEYQESYWCNFEVDFTHHMSMELKEKIIIPVLKEDCDIPDHLKLLTYIDAREDIQKWLPRLVTAIESPVEERTQKYEQCDSNTHYRNLDTVQEIRSRISCGSSMSFQTTRYLPDALNSRAFNLDSGVYYEILQDVSRTKYFRVRPCCLPCCPTVCAVVVLLVVGSLFLTFFILSNRPYVDGKHTTVISKNGTALNPVYSAFGLFYFWLLLGWPVCCCLYFWKGRTMMSKVLRRANQRLITHNLILAHRFQVLTATMKFIYFNYQPCLDYVENVLQSQIDNPLPSQANVFDRDTGQERENESANIDATVSVNLHQQNKGSDQCTGPAEEMIIPLIPEVEQSVPISFREMAENMLIDLSVDYIEDFVTEKLENSNLKRHTSRAMCLCQYAETKNTISSSTRCSV